MTNIVSDIQQSVVEAVEKLYGERLDRDQFPLQPTRKEFEGDYTLVVFPLTRIARKKPEEIGTELGALLVDTVEELVSYNVIKGFLNLQLSDQYWNAFLQEALQQEDFGQAASNGQKVMVEFASPNTNKPLHLGHIRNILLGWSSSRILEAAGYEVIRVQIVNDRGIAICKSMLAWKEFGEGSTPESSGMKSDHFVGKWYVEFEKRFKKEYETWQSSAEGRKVLEEGRKEGESEKEFFQGFKNDYFNEYSELAGKAREMLLLWEAGDEATRSLWKKMNDWVYAGFEETYQKLGVRFDKLYYESNTYLLGKDIIEKGLKDGLFYRKKDGSVWIDLEDAKLDHKLVLRSDGTSVYMTQDLGTARLRYQDYGLDKMVYVVAVEQKYHFEALFEILKRLGEPFSEGLYHLSYGMVDLPEGKMKSREGTVVDADDLIAEVIEEARLTSLERGEIADLPKAGQEDLLRKIGMAALKFFIIKVQPKKGMTFNPKESVDLQGHTGPYVQYSYVRISGITERGRQEGVGLGRSVEYDDLQDLERELLKQAYEFPGLIQEAADVLEPSLIANYCYDMAKTYSKFWHELPVFNAKDEGAKAFRLQLSALVGHILKKGMDLLGIEMPDRM